MYSILEFGICKLLLQVSASSTPALTNTKKRMHFFFRADLAGSVEGLNWCSRRTLTSGLLLRKSLGQASTPAHKWAPGCLRLSSPSVGYKTHSRFNFLIAPIQKRPNLYGSAFFVLVLAEGLEPPRLLGTGF